jgi:hypothetical protein
MLTIVINVALLRHTGCDPRPEGALNGCVNGWGHDIFEHGSCVIRSTARVASVNVACNPTARDLRVGQAKYRCARRDDYQGNDPASGEVKLWSDCGQPDIMAERAIRSGAARSRRWSSPTPKQRLRPAYEPTWTSPTCINSLSGLAASVNVCPAYGIDHSLFYPHQ